LIPSTPRAFWYTEAHSGHFPFPPGLEDVNQALHVDREVLQRRQRAETRDRKVKYLVDLVRTSDLVQPGLVGHVELLDLRPLAQFVLNEVRLARYAVLRQHHVLAKVQQRPRRMQADEPQAARNQGCHIKSPPSMRCETSERYSI
jgi:hypothetical protein